VPGPVVEIVTNATRTVITGAIGSELACVEEVTTARHPFLKARARYLDGDRHADTA
jgi:hypothetical protein